jgi:hypothetical protein
MDTVFRYNVLFHERVVFGVFQRLLGFVTGLFRHVDINGAVITAFMVRQLVDCGYDLVVFPIVLMKFKWYIAVPLLTFFAGIFCRIIIWGYDKLQLDFIGIESAKKEMGFFKSQVADKLDEIGNSLEKKFQVPFGEIRFKYNAESFKKVLERVWFVEFLFCTFQFDAVVTTIYLREKSFGGMTGRDWKVFLASVTLSCVYWSFVVLTGIAIYEWSEEVVLVILLAVWEQMRVLRCTSHDPFIIILL